eukprot:TRINITY_DN5168_c0_g1_i1.p1 TRINITY_DN5168_c0_g1~~TRINITY_DN5168_c0_g1_i1.p1  ORF type:complete len:1311 (-),score=351.95 TRINITY_DN5168_c0_g1_i1:214-4146(-)
MMKGGKGGLVDGMNDGMFARYPRDFHDGPPFQEPSGGCCFGPPCGSHHGPGGGPPPLWMDMPPAPGEAPFRGGGGCPQDWMHDGPPMQDQMPYRPPPQQQPWPSPGPGLGPGPGPGAMPGPGPDGSCQQQQRPMPFGGHPCGGCGHPGQGPAACGKGGQQFSGPCGKGGCNPEGAVLVNGWPVPRMPPQQQQRPPMPSPMGPPTSFEVPGGGFLQADCGGGLHNGPGPGFRRDRQGGFEGGFEGPGGGFDGGFDGVDGPQMGHFVNGVGSCGSRGPLHGQAEEMWPPSGPGPPFPCGKAGCGRMVGGGGGGGFVIGAGTGVAGDMPEFFVEGESGCWPAPFPEARGELPRQFGGASGPPMYNKGGSCGSGKGQQLFPGPLPNWQGGYGEQGEKGDKGRPWKGKGQQEDFDSRFQGGGGSKWKKGKDGKGEKGDKGSKADRSYGKGDKGAKGDKGDKGYKADKGVGKKGGKDFSDKGKGYNAGSSTGGRYVPPPMRSGGPMPMEPGMSMPQDFGGPPGGKGLSSLLQKVGVPKAGLGPPGSPNMMMPQRVPPPTPYMRVDENGRLRWPPNFAQLLRQHKLLLRQVELPEALRTDVGRAPRRAAEKLGGKNKSQKSNLGRLLRASWVLHDDDGGSKQKAVEKAFMEASMPSCGSNAEAGAATASAAATDADEPTLEDLHGVVLRLENAVPGCHVTFGINGEACTLSPGIFRRRGGVGLSSQERRFSIEPLSRQQEHDANAAAEPSDAEAAEPSPACPTQEGEREKDGADQGDDGQMEKSRSASKLSGDGSLGSLASEERQTTHKLPPAAFKATVTLDTTEVAAKTSQELLVPEIDIVGVTDTSAVIRLGNLTGDRFELTIYASGPSGSEAEAAHGAGSKPTIQQKGPVRSTESTQRINQLECLQVYVAWVRVFCDAEGEVRESKQKGFKTLQAREKTIWDEFDHVILGVAQTATAKEITKAFRMKSLQYHPDKETDPDKKDAAEEMMKRLNLAKQNMMKCASTETPSGASDMVPSPSQDFSQTPGGGQFGPGGRGFYGAGYDFSDSEEFSDSDFEAAVNARYGPEAAQAAELRRQQEAERRRKQEAEKAEAARGLLTCSLRVEASTPPKLKILTRGRTTIDVEASGLAIGTQVEVQTFDEATCSWKAALPAESVTSETMRFCVEDLEENSQYRVRLRTTVEIEPLRLLFARFAKGGVGKPTMAARTASDDDEDDDEEEEDDEEEAEAGDEASPGDGPGASESEVPPSPPQGPESDSVAHVPGGGPRTKGVRLRNNTLPKKPMSPTASEGPAADSYWQQHGGDEEEVLISESL